MKNKLSVLLFALILISGILQSQTLSPTVISSSGGFYSTGSAMLSFTVAEMTMVQTFTAGGNFLTQGFQQPEDYVVGIPENPTVTGDILIYPNPTSGIFTLSYISNSSGENIIIMYNLVGQVVLTKAVLQSAGTNTVTFDISSFSQGIYMLELTTENSKGEKQINYNKINLVY
ncbi:MAG: T9SS type A sorting domain-containing protein [Bacteroidota bacterium]